MFWKVRIRGIDKKVKAKREENARPAFRDPSAIDADNSYGPFTMTKDGLFRATKDGQARVCIAFKVLGIMRQALDPGETQSKSDGLKLDLDPVSSTATSTT